MDSNEQKITIVAVREENDLVSLDTISQPHLELLNVPVISKQKDFIYGYNLPHAIAATPARYLQAAVSIISSSLTTAGALILNPLMDFNAFGWLHLCDRLRNLPRDTPCLITDEQDFPIGIYLPRSLLALQNFIFLRFLSCVSAALDMVLLNRKFPNVQLVILSCKAQVNTASRYVPYYVRPNYFSNFKLITMQYLRASEYIQANTKMIAVMPYLAGDVLFFAKAFCETQHPFTHIMVNKDFADIAAKLIPAEQLLIIPNDPPKRGTNADGAMTWHGNEETAYLWHEIFPSLPSHAIYYYFRPSREYSVSDFHLIDQWKFSLSDDAFNFVNQSFPRPAVRAKTSDKSVLLHFDGGWDLKIYPQDYQQQLVNLLHNAGYTITILSDKSVELPVKYRVSFTTLTNLEHQIRAHAIVLGMDSFPAHYATHYLRHPTITLFSSTRADNSNAYEDQSYKYLQKTLKCCPCNHLKKCPIYQTNYCKNFITPNEAFLAIDAMYQAVYSEEKV